MLLIALALIAILAVGCFYYWTRRRGPATAGQAGGGGSDSRRTWLVTEVVAYVGGILILAGGAAAIDQRWDAIGHWGHASVFAGVAAFFFLVGMVARPVRVPAVQRLADVAWFVSVAGMTGAIGFVVHQVYGNTSEVTTLAVGTGIAAYSAVLWLVRRHALQNLALFAGLITAIVGVIFTIDKSAPTLAFDIALWTFGLAWAVLGWREYVGPPRVTLISGAILALVVLTPSFEQFGWMRALAIVTAAAAMAASVPLRSTALLALGALEMLVDVTNTVTHYFRQTLGVPGALAITGVLIVGLALVSARLMRATRSTKPEGSGTEQPSPPAPPEISKEPSRGELSPRDLSSAR